MAIFSVYKKIMIEKIALISNKSSVFTQKINLRSSQVLIMSGLVMLLSLLVLMAWEIKLPVLLNVFKGAPTMKFNTALSFLFSSIGVLSVLQKKRSFQLLKNVMGAIVLLIGFASFLEYILEIDLHIDNFFIQDPFSVSAPGRMSRTTGLCFSFLGLALLASRSSKSVFRKFHKFALGLVALIAVMAVFTYFLQGLTSAKVLIFNSMAFHTAISFFLLSLALSLTDPKNSYSDFISGVKIGNGLARKLLPFLVFAPIVLGAMLLYTIGSGSLNTELGIAVYTVAYATLGLLYTSWIAVSLNREDLERRKLEISLKRSTKELTENVRFKKKLVATTPEFILIINLSTLSIRYLNKDISPEENLVKERIEGISLKKVLPYIHPADREKITELHRQLIKSSNETIHDIEIRLNLKEDKWEWFSLRGKVFHRPDGVWLEEYMLLLRNITHQKQVQKDLLQAQQFSIQGKIARTLAHELRNPIASIGMVKQVMAKSIGESEKQRLDKYLEILDRSNKTLEKLVNNLLDSSFYQPAELSRQDLIPLVENSIQKAGDRFFLSGVELIKNYSGSYHILADTKKLEIAILNILLNASEATTPDEGVIEVMILEEEAEVVLSISDNGEGLKEGQTGKLFDAFYTSKDSGMGVGLNSVKTIIEEHHARITVDSKSNQGTQFKIYFPKLK